MRLRLPIELNVFDVTTHMVTFYFFATWWDLFNHKAWETPGRVSVRHSDSRTVVTIKGGK